MRNPKFTETQIAFILKQANEGTTITEGYRKAGIIEATFYDWRTKHADLSLGRSFAS